MRKQLYRLEMLTPMPQFIGPVLRKTTARSSKKQKDEADEPFAFDIFYSDGEEEAIVVWLNEDIRVFVLRK